MSEEGIAKGIRRVTAVTTDFAFEALRKASELEQEVNEADKLEGSLLEQVYYYNKIILFTYCICGYFVIIC